MEEILKDIENLKQECILKEQQLNELIKRIEKLEKSADIKEYKSLIKKKEVQVYNSFINQKSELEEQIDFIKKRIFSIRIRSNICTHNYLLWLNTDIDRKREVCYCLDCAKKVSYYDEYEEKHILHLSEETENLDLIKIYDRYHELKEEFLSTSEIDNILKVDFGKKKELNLKNK